MFFKFPRTPQVADPSDHIRKHAERRLRDEFAGLALMGIMANPERWKQIASDYESGKKNYEQCSVANATKAYSIADAMMEARKR